MTDKLFGALSLCRKAGKLKLGMDVACEALAKKECFLLLFSADLSPRSMRKAVQTAQQVGIKTRILPYTMEQLALITGKPYGVLAVCERNFAGMISTGIDEQSLHFDRALQRH